MERATTIRMPSTANLMVDSADRNTTSYPSAWDFAIQKNQSIQNGYFTRVGTTEVVLEWCEQNVVGDIIFDVSGASTRENVTISFGASNFTVAELMDQIAAQYNDAVTSKPAGTTMSVSVELGAAGLDLSGGKFQVVSTPLALALGLNIGDGLESRQAITGCTDLRPYRYVDIVAPQLTYAQDLKDNSTQTSNRDVLCRWYFDEDVPENLDAYGYPILMGYKPFFRRRIFNPPKQIKWDPNLPIGNLTFQVYDQTGSQLPASSSKSNFLMTLQLSEN